MLSQFLGLSLLCVIDLNRATPVEIKALPVDSILTYRIYYHREIYGEFQSVYDLRNVQGMTPETFETIKPLVMITHPRKSRQELVFVLDEQRKLATEEPPNQAAVDEWENLIISPLNINHASFADLLMIDRMTPQDAQAILRYRHVRTVKNQRELSRDVKGLSHYAYLTLRRYVIYHDTIADKMFSVSARQTLETQNRVDIGQESDNNASIVAYLRSAVNEFDRTRVKLRNQNLSDRDCDNLYANLVSAYNERNERSGHPELSTRVRGRYKDNLKLGGYIDYPGFAPNETHHSLKKGYLAIANLGPVHRFYLGNYSLCLGQGLMMENDADYRARHHTKTQGLYGDLTENSSHRLFGAAGRIATAYFEPLVFFSQNEKHCLTNPDGTVAGYWSPRNLLTPDRFTEKIVGTSLPVLVPTGLLAGSCIALEGMRIDYDRDLGLAPRWFDYPDDETDYRIYPEISQTFYGREQEFGGLDLRAVLANVSIEGEAVREFGNDALAYLIKSRIQYDWLYLILLFRHYDVDYDNPYGRGFYEQRRFEDTPFERPYTLVNPIFYYLTEDPRPKPEEGFYLETRYQISRYFSISRAYLDFWKNLGWAMPNSRVQVEFEYRPAFPVRLRVSQKWQKKYLPGLFPPAVQLLTSRL